MRLLSNKIIFLTGGSRGIGFECAKKYIEAGANVVNISNDKQSLEEAGKQLGKKNYGILCDVSQGRQVQEAIEETLHKYKRIDVIHNNAGVGYPSKPLHETDESEWHDLMNINLTSIYYTTKYGIEALKRSQGCILNTSSLVGQIGQHNHAAYTATKGAVNALTKSMALDYAPFKIRVNAVAPAAVWTQMLRDWSNEQENAESIGIYISSIHPLGYCPEGDVIADACVFLISEMARFITGNILPVTGGAELGYRQSAWKPEMYKGEGLVPHT